MRYEYDAYEASDASEADGGFRDVEDTEDMPVKALHFPCLLQCHKSFRVYLGMIGKPFL